MRHAEVVLALRSATAWMIRDARRADVATLAEVRNASWRAAYRGIIPEAELGRMSIERSRRLLDDAVVNRRRGHQLLVVEDERATPFGYALSGPLVRSDLGHRGEVFELYLRPDAQRRGAGTQLLASALWRLTELGLAPVMLWVLAANPACRFYAACGGRPFRRERIDVGGRTLERIGVSWDGFLPLPP